MRVGLSLPLMLLELVLAFQSVQATTWVMEDNYVGEGFFAGFTWNTFDDPTHGRVNYVDALTARQKQLSYALGTNFVMRADNTSMVPSSARGRDSVRITSNKAYNDSILVLDIAHMPQGCSTWPAFWTCTAAGPWPVGGEIDIIEGVNTNQQNLASLHTTPNCAMSSSRKQLGSSVSTDCNTAVNSNQGCGTSFAGSDTYGTSFNSAGGGWYVLHRTAAHGAFVWFWGRNDGSVPSTIRYGYDAITPDSSWGTPQASFPSSSSCNFAQHFSAHQIIFDLTLCGDWAGAAFPSAGCGPSSCEDYVDNNPSAFTDAYWDINALRVYTPYQ